MLEKVCIVVDRISVQFDAVYEENNKERLNDEEADKDVHETTARPASRRVRVGVTGLFVVHRVGGGRERLGEATRRSPAKLVYILAARWVNDQ